MDIVTAFVAVWQSILTFITETVFPAVLGLFWSTAETGGGLTFIGVMAVIMAGIALVLLVFNLIRSFFSMRG